MVHENSLNNLLCYIVGPTASGKTELALRLCEKRNGEVLGADSMQIYKEIQIGTAKPTKEEVGDRAYHLIDYVSPDRIYTVSEYKDDALKLIDSILSQNKLPIVCGGTGLYVNSLLYKMDFTNSSYDLGLREKLNKMSKDEQLSKLKDLDPKTYEEIDKMNNRRVIRALEICLLSKEPKSRQVYDYKKHKRDYNHKVFIIDIDRQLLYDRINKRVDIMFQEGLVDEIQYLITKYKDINKPIFQFIGYKEVLEYLDGKCSLSEAKELIKRNTRHFAKRQLTWFRGLGDDGIWIKYHEDKELMLKNIIEILGEN